MPFTVDHFVHELATVFIDDAERRAAAREIRFPEARLPQTNTSLAFWQELVRRIQHGVLPDGGGIEVLGQAVSRMYPGNAIFRAAAELDQTPPAPAPAPGPVHDGVPWSPPTPSPRPAPDPDPGPPYRVLELVGSERYDELLDTVRRLDPRASLLWSQFNHFAVRVFLQPFDERTLHTELERMGLRLTATVREYPYRPHLLQRLAVEGPDRQRFNLGAVPNTALVDEIPPAVLGEYNERAVTDRLGRRMRTVVDLVHADGRMERLSPGRTLHESGVRDGALLRISTESTAGVSDHEYRAQAVRARNEIYRFAKENPDEFQIISAEPSDLPAKYVIRLNVPGFAEPPAGSGDPEKISEHLISIHLPPGHYPMKAPVVSWESDVFHPNIGVRDIPRVGTLRRLCLGILDAYYVEEMEFGELCQMIIDVACYRQYTLPASEDPGGPGVFYEAAAEWATSEPGQEMILSIGGASKETRRATYVGEHKTREFRISRATTDTP